ncbi:hypothetical protein FRC12_001645 [Ceratobasidium sp. 428]|nr:hypothetical protein FRC12_001645 [Ceratobasidium sp. 428]
MDVYEQAGPDASIQKAPLEFLAKPGQTNNQSTIPVPISLLPLEILSNIFILTALPLPCVSINSIGYKLSPLVVIPSVCTTWRRLAMNLGSLWSHVDILGGYRKADCATLSLNWTILWLERAGGAPMSFHFQNSQSSWDGDADLYVDVDPQLYDILLPHISRAVSLTFSDVRQVHAQNLLNLYALRCPPGQLQVLSVMKITPTSSFTDRFIWPTGNLRGLTVLHLMGLGRQVSPNLDELVSMLLNSPTLHTLRLCGSHHYMGDHDYPEIILPNLKYVEILPITSTTSNYRLLKALMPGNLALHVRVKPNYK